VELIQRLDLLVEKVHIVWSPTAGIPRFKSRIYVVCFITVALYLVIISLLLVGKIIINPVNLLSHHPDQDVYITLGMVI
jgi:hypothetical protein